MENKNEVAEVSQEVIDNMNQRLTDQTYANRVKSDWEWLAKEVVRVERIKGVYYGYSSELGCLRLMNHYCRMGSAKNVRAFFSENMSTWVFALDMNQ